jgi:predicted site-specific integrase-resolvase
MELTVSQYARRAGISVYTARRRIRRGDVPYRRERRKYIVILPDEGVVEAGEAEMSRKPTERIRLRDESAGRAADIARLRTELSDAREMISELRRQRDLLERQLEARRQTEADPVRELEAERLDQQRVDDDSPR